MDGWMDRWMNGWIDGWMNGWMDIIVNDLKFETHEIEFQIDLQ